MTSSIGGFFSGGGRKGVSFPEIGTSVTGTIKAVHPPEPVLDPKDKTPTGKQQVRIDLETEERDSNIEFDDGSRTLYVKSWMTNAVGEALRKVGESEPKPGGRLTVTFVRQDSPERPGLTGAKFFEATYVPPTSATAQHFGGTVGAGGAGNGAGSMAPMTAEPQRPAAITEQAWNQMDDATKRSVAATMASVPAGSDAPPF